MTLHIEHGEPLCKEADSDAPCRYWTTCPETRRRLQHYAGLRGVECWAFQQISEKANSAAPGGAAAGDPQ